MSSLNLFEHRSVIPAPVERVLAFHAAPDALRQLTMPPTRITIQADRRRSLTEGEIAFTLWLGPIPVRWVAEHAPGPNQTSFTDRMLRGPVAHWEHQHIMQPHPEGTGLIDRIRYAHKPGPRGLLTRLVFGRPALRMLFAYRHWRTRHAVR
jgi:ligand-binding SRPBCC domain-containing protein